MPAPIRTARPLALTALLAISGLLSPWPVADARAATGYQCGPGAPDLGARRCSCPPGTLESTDKKGISRCVAAPKPTASAAPIASSSASASASASTSASASASAAPPPRCLPDMVALPAGAFAMAGRVDPARVAPYCLDRVEVTVDAYARCLTAGKCTAPQSYMAVDADPKWRVACNYQNPGRGDHPVNCVDFLQASAYCAFVGKRTPSEEEWEWAARGGDEARTYPWGNDLPDASRANVCGAECAARAKAQFGLDFQSMPGVQDPWPETAPVGKLPRGASKHGALDLAGNVNEWTSSPFQTGSANVVVRGGAWDSYAYLSLFATQRRGFSPSLSNATIGFRCAKTL